MRKLLPPVISALLFLAAACAGNTPLPPEYGYGKNAVLIHVHTPQNLAPWQSGEARLGICVYQLSETADFERCAEDRLGLEGLKDCLAVPPGGVTAKKLSIRPDQDYTFALNRAEGAKYVGIVAGYAGKDRASTVRLFEIPLVEVKKGWLLRKSLEAEDLVVHLELGPDGIEASRSGSGVD